MRHKVVSAVVLGITVKLQLQLFLFNWEFPTHCCGVYLMLVCADIVCYTNTFWDLDSKGLSRFLKNMSLSVN